MGRIVVSTNPVDASEREVFEHSGPFIDWLLGRYPDGFATPHFSMLNLQKLEVEDYDTEIGEDDTLVLAVLPAVPAAAFAALGTFWSAVAAVVVNTAISIGLSYAVNALFGPSGSAPSAPAGSAASSPVAGSVYSLATPTNVARIGQPIPAIYGRNLVVPDQAMQSYSFFENNQHYVDQIMCLGQGEFEIEQVKVADSNVAEMSDGVVSHWILPSSSHQKTFGNVEALTGIRENVYTSAEVSDQELFAGQAGVGVYSANCWNGCWDDCDLGILAIFWLTPEAGEYAEAMNSGREVFMVVPSGPNQGTWKVQFIISSKNAGRGDSDALMHKKGNVAGYYDANDNLVPALWNAGYNGPVTLTYVRPGSPTGFTEGGPVGPFVASPACTLTTHLQYDLVWPVGCYRVDSETGALLSFTVSGTFVAELVDNYGVPIGPSYTFDWTETMQSNTPQRRTYDHVVPEGRYRVTAERTSGVSDRAQDQSKVHWTGLKSILGTYCDSTDEVYGDVTLLAVRIRASEGLSTQSHNRVSVRCTRKLEGTAVRHPTDAFRDIMLNTTYGGARPTSELDEEALDLALSETPNCTFDAIFDQRSSVWEALTLSVQLIRGVPITDGSIISLVRDKPQTTAVAAFTEANIVDLTRSFLFVHLDDTDGIEGEYVDPIDGSKQYVLWPSTSVNPEPVTLWGSTSRARAQCFVEQFWKQRRLRGRLTSFETEADGHTLLLGDPINITHSTLGPDPVLHIVSSVAPKDKVHVTVEAYIYEPGVFEP